MRKNVFAAMAAASKSVSYLAMFFMVVVFNFSLTGCDPADQEMRTTSDTYEVKKPHTPDDEPTPDPSLSWSFGYTNSNKGWNLTTNWWVRETTNQFNDAGVSRNAVSHKDDRYAVADNLREVSLSYTQERTYAGQLSTKTVSSSMTRKVYEDSIRWTAAIEDGNLCYLDAVDQRIEAEVRDTLRKLPYVRTVDAKVTAINTLPGTTKYLTRSAYVSDSICREVVWVVEKEVVGNGLVAGGERFTQELRDTFKVLLLSEDDIARGYTKDKNRVVIDDVTERCSFTEVLVMKSGEEHENPRNYVLNRLVKGIDEYTKDVTSFNYTWRYDNSISLGNVSKGIRKENNWTVDSRTDSFGALISNGAEPITTSYTYYHEGCTYKDERVEVEFPLITPVMKEFNSHVESIVSDNEGYEQSRLFNTISTEYLGWNQNVGETVKLQMPKAAPEIVIVSEGWEYDKIREVDYNDSIAWYLTYYIEYSDGTRTETPFHFSDDRLLELLSNWTSIENNETESTGDITIGSASLRNMTATQKGAEASWVRETRTLANNVQLAGSTQENRWRSIEPNDFSVTYRGKTFTFPKNSIYTENVSNVTGGSVVGDYKVYNYTDDMSYSFGDNTKRSVAPGTIKVPAVTIISEGWDASSAREVWSDTKVNWTLDWVVKFSNGSEDRISFAAEAPRTYTVDTNWTSEEANANYTTSSYVVNITKTENQSKTVNGATFNWTRETRSIKTNVQLAASTQENRWTAVDPFSCSVTYKGKTYDFGRKSISFSHQDNLTGGTESNGFKVYNYGDDMSYTVADNTKSLTAPGTIKVPAVTVVSEGWDASSAREVWSDTKVNWTLDWVVKFSNGSEDRTTFTVEDGRTYTVDTNWTSEEANANYTTSSYVVNITNSENQSKTVNGATFNWTRETRSIKTNVQLAGSNQLNLWTAVDPFSCSVTYKGKTYDFGRKNMSLSHQDNLTGGTESNGFKVYNYGDAMSYTVADNTKSLTAPGTIRVKVEVPEPEIPTFFPKDWGELKEVKQTVANNKAHDGYVYTWSLHFENEGGIKRVLPVVVEPGSTNPSWNFNYVEVTMITAYNGGTFEAATGSWVNTIAADETNHMVWSREGGERANKNYKEAKSENWDEGHLIKNRPSTKTSRYNFSITDGVLSATDTYTGKFMGSWSSYVAK